MMSTARTSYLVSALIAIAAGAGCRQRDARAQGADPALGPVECYELVADIVASTTGLDLCTVATSPAPGECYLEAVRRVHDLTTDQMVTLCRRATSLDTLECYERLDAEGTITQDQAIGYCAMRCPLGPAPPQASSAACIEEGLDRTNLAAQMVGELCINSRSAGPVDCFLRGENTTQLPDSQLVSLCGQKLFSCQYVNTPPPE